MKGGLCVIYTSLLTVSVLSSCVVLLFVVTEALQVNGEGGPAVDASGLHNVSKKVSSVIEQDVEHTPPPDLNKDGVQESQNEDRNPEMTFADTLSLNSVTTDGLPDTGQPPILISLADNTKFDLKNADELLFVNDSEQHNDSKTFTIVDVSENVENKQSEEKEQETLIFKAKPMHEVKQTEDAFQQPPASVAAPEAESVVEPQTEPEQSLEHTENIPVKTTTPQEDIPSFSEWAQKQLAEAAKQDTVLNHSTQTSHSNTNFSSKSTKVRSKNYASPACGAKIVAVNPEAGSASAILSPNRDEYMLNTCNSRIWFVVELCEAVQAQKMEIANFELFSSTPKDIAVSFSDRFPTRDWASVGQFTADDMRDVQSFDLYPQIFGKFIKVELLSHHGSEHYCPISLFKVYGTSEFEVLEKESSQHSTHIDDDDDEDDETINVPDVPSSDTDTSKNLFGSARDAVMSIMKKAAQVLVKTEVPKNMSSEQNDTSTDKIYKRCCSPSHIIVCDNCSEVLYNEVYDLISCSSDKLTNLVRHVFLGDTLKCTDICQPYGLYFKSTKSIEFRNQRVSYVNALFPPKYLAALCNILAIKEKKVVLNTSFESELNVTKNTTEKEPLQNVGTEVNVEQDIKLPVDDSLSDSVKPVEIKNVDTASDTNEQVEDVKLEITEEPPIEEVVEENKDQDTIADNKSEIVKIDSADTVQPMEPDTKPVEKPKQEQEINDNTQKDKVDIIKNGNKEAEKPKEVNTEESSEQLLIENDSFLSDLDQLTVDPTPPGNLANQNNQNPAQSLQKESVFLRLSNRVKTLERNMSLSGQYLEELSRRYKKQVEEMQKTFEKTVLQMTEERRKSNEREQRYLDQMNALQDQLEQVAAAMKILMEERDSWFGSLTFFKFLVFQTAIIVGALYYVTKRRKETPQVIPNNKKIRKKEKEKLRRKSVEGVSGHATPAIKKRRPSEEALQIARQSTEDVNDDDSGEWQIARRNRRRKTSIVHRNIELEKAIWSRKDSIGKLQENPISLDEEEYLAPVSEPKEFNENVPVPKKEFPKTNGSIFSSIRAKTKTRRLSSPAFLRTFSRQSSKNTPSLVVKNLEPMYNSHDEKKETSESPTSSLWSNSTELSQLNSIDSVPRTKKKSLKNLFKKVF